jgi:hypothetical protein
MPWEIKAEHGKFYVVNKNTHEKKNKEGYTNKADAVKYMRALYANTGSEALQK